MRQEGRTPHSRSTSRDSSARLWVRLCRLRSPDPGELKPDVLRSVVVDVALVATNQTLKVLSIAVVVVGKPTGQTPIRGVL